MVGMKLRFVLFINDFACFLGQNSGCKCSGLTETAKGYGTKCFIRLREKVEGSA